MKFQQIRGATVKTTYAGQTFLIDPFLAPKDAYPPLEACHNPDLRWPTVDLPLSPAEIISGVDALIITHLHPDHLDEYALKLLPRALPLFAQDEIDAKALKELGFTNIRILTGNGLIFNGITLYRIKGLHGRPESTQKYYDAANLRAEACGVIFKSEDEQTFYLAGDTIWYEKVEQALKSFTPDIVALNAAGAQFNDSGAIIMDLSDILEVVRAVPQAKIIITHMDAVPHATVNRQDVRELVEKHRLKNILIPEDGETLVL